MCCAESAQNPSHDAGRHDPPPPQSAGPIRVGVSGPRAALQLALAERQERAIAQLLEHALDSEELDERGEPLHRGDNALLLRLWTEAYGKPGEAAPVEPGPEPVLEDVVAQGSVRWRSITGSAPRLGPLRAAHPQLRSTTQPDEGPSILTTAQGHSHAGRRKSNAGPRAPRAGNAARAPA